MDESRRIWVDLRSSGQVAAFASYLHLTESPSSADDLAIQARAQGVDLQEAYDRFRSLTTAGPVRPPVELRTAAARSIAAPPQGLAARSGVDLYGREPTDADQHATEINRTLEHGIRHEDDDARFWSVGTQSSPFMRRMAAIIDGRPASVRFFYPQQDTPIGLTMRSGDGHVDRIHAWGDEIVMGGGIPVTTSPHERTHLIPVALATEKGPAGEPPLLPTVPFPEIDTNASEGEIAVTIVERMFADEALAGLSEIMTANDLVMAGADPRGIPRDVWEMKRVYDAGGLDAYLRSRLYLGDNHKLIYPLAAALQLAKKLKAGANIGTLNIPDVGNIDPSTVSADDLREIWEKHSETMVAKFKGYIERDPLKHVGDATKFDRMPDEMRNAAFILGALTQRFEPLLQRSDQPQDVAALSLAAFPLLASLTGERASEVLGLMVRHQETLSGINAPRNFDGDVHRTVPLTATYQVAQTILAARGYTHQAALLNEKLRRQLDVGKSQDAPAPYLRAAPGSLSALTRGRHEFQPIVALFDAWTKALEAWDASDQEDAEAFLTDMGERFAHIEELLNHGIIEVENADQDDGGTLLQLLFFLAYRSLDFYQHHFPTHHPSPKARDHLIKLQRAEFGLTDHIVNQIPPERGERTMELREGSYADEHSDITTCDHAGDLRLLRDDSHRHPDQVVTEVLDLWDKHVAFPHARGYLWSSFLEYQIERPDDLQRFAELIVRTTTSQDTKRLATLNEDSAAEDSCTFWINTTQSYLVAHRRLNGPPNQLDRVVKTLNDMKRRFEEAHLLTDWSPPPIDHPYTAIRQPFIPEGLPDGRGINKTQGVIVLFNKERVFVDRHRTDTRTIDERLRAAADSLAAGQPLIPTRDQMTAFAANLAEAALHQYAAEAFDIALFYPAEGSEQSQRELRTWATEVDASGLEPEVRDEIFVGAVEHLIPPRAEGNDGWREWQTVMSRAEVIAPTIISGPHPKARPLLLARLASYADPREQRFELLPVDAYQRALVAVANPLVLRHPELLEPGFYERFRALAPSEAGTAQMYHRALAALFPFETRRLNSTEDLMTWEGDLIDMGAMDPTAVERQLIGELGGHMRNYAYPADRALKLTQILSAFVRFRVGEYVRDVGENPDEVTYRHPDLQEIPILNYLYYSLDGNEGHHAYADVGLKAVSEGIAVAPTGIWDYLEPDDDAPPYTLSPVQEAVLSAILTSQNRSEAAAKTAIYQQCLAFKQLGPRYKQLAFESFVRSGRVSPYLNHYYDRIKDDPAELTWMMDAVGRFLGTTEGPMPHDISFATLLRARERGHDREAIFWERYEHMWRGLRAITDDEGGAQSQWEKMKSLTVDFFFDTPDLDKARRERGLFTDPDRQLSPAVYLDRHLLTEFMALRGDIHPPFSREDWHYDILISRLVQNPENHFQLPFVRTARTLELLEDRKALQGIHHMGHCPWLGIPGLFATLGRDEGAWGAYLQGVRRTRENLFAIRDEIREDTIGSLPPSIANVPPLPRLFLTEAWTDMTPTERTKRKTKLDELGTGVASSVAVRTLIEEEGLEKLGQLIYMLHGVVPDPWREPFARTLEENRPATFYEVRQTIEVAHGCPLSDLYSAFDEIPVGVGTIAQVHRAVRKDDGRIVAVKVALPSRAVKVGRGLDRLEVATAWYALQSFRFDTPIDVVAFARWFKGSMQPEFNMGLEAANTALYANAATHLDLKGRIPQVSSDRIRPEVIELSWVDTNGEGEVEDTAAIVDTVLHSLFLGGLVHDDPHKKNIRGRYLLDHGRMEQLDRTERRQWADFLKDLAIAHMDEQHIDPLIDAFARLSGTKRWNGPRRADLHQFLTSDAFRGQPLDGKLLTQVIARGGQAGLPLGPRGYVVLKTFVALDSLGKSVDPAFNLGVRIAPVLAEAYARDFPELPQAMTTQWKKACEQAELKEKAGAATRLFSMTPPPSSAPAAVPIVSAGLAVFPPGTTTIQ